MNKEPYDNFITSFKKKLWDTCIQNQVFENLQNSEFEKVKSIFETNIENYKSHILQTNGDNNIINLLISNIKKEIENTQKNVETREDISNLRREQFDSEFQKKQNEFKSLLEDKKPDNVDFSDDAQDAPLEAENLEALIQEQLKDRELHMPVQSSENNVIVSDNQFTEMVNIEPTQKVNNNQENKDNLTLLLKENENLVLEISKLRQQINSQNSAINKILTSQILILKKLK